jgi:FAD-linked oxidoreductase
MPHFQNWSADVKSTPAQILMPASEAEIVQIVKDAAAQNRKIRVVGSGHSFTPLCHTNDILLSLDKMRGLEDVDKATCQATILAGTKIKDLGHLLFAEEMALANQGEVDAQAIAGALSTGTHGSGVTLGSMATMIVAMRIVRASGEIIDCSDTENAEIFKAAQVAMGMMGIITKVRLQLIPAYKLYYYAEKTTISNCLSRLTELKKHRNFEFFYFPHTEVAQIKIMNTTEEAPQPYGFANYLSDMVLENGIFQVLSTISKYIAPLTIPIAKIVGMAVSSASRKCWSNDAYPTARLVRFHEMEYNIPAERIEEVFMEIKQAIDKQKFRVHFPIECRFVKADDIWLSPAYQRESAYIAVHQYQGMDYKEYFAAVEKICQKYGGRPHWGKLNTVDTNYLQTVYPKLPDFLAVRRQLDPEGMFLNGYLEGIFK